MNKTILLMIALISLITTCITPFIFNAYIETWPTNNIISFGGPFPFLSEEMTLPQDAKFPLKIDFHLNQINQVTFHYISFVLSFLGIFLLFFLIAAILLRFFKKGR